MAFHLFWFYLDQDFLYWSNRKSKCVCVQLLLLIFFRLFILNYYINLSVFESLQRTKSAIEREFRLSQKKAHLTTGWTTLEQDEINTRKSKVKKLYWINRNGGLFSKIYSKQGRFWHFLDKKEGFGKLGS